MKVSTIVFNIHDGKCERVLSEGTQILPVAAERSGQIIISFIDSNNQKKKDMFLLLKIMQMKHINMLQQLLLHVIQLTKEQLIWDLIIFFTKKIKRYERSTL